MSKSVTFYWTKSGHVLSTSTTTDEMTDHLAWASSQGLRPLMDAIETVITECVMVNKFVETVGDTKDPSTMAEFVFNAGKPSSVYPVCPEHGNMKPSKHKADLFYCPLCKMRRNSDGYFTAK